MPHRTPGAIRLVRLGGTQFEVHGSLLVVLGLIAVVLATWWFPVAKAPGSYLPLELGLLGVAGAVVLLLSLLLHELAHVAAARLCGHPVDRVTLLFLHSQRHALPEDEASPWHEMFVSAAGPFITLALGIGTHVLDIRFGSVRLVAPVLNFCAMTNLTLAVVQVVPGFPLDGGRFLRAMAWGLAGDPIRGTRWAATASFGFAVMLGTACLLATMIPGLTVLALWGLLMAVVLGLQARALGRSAQFRSRVAGLVVGDVMDRLPVALPRIMSVADALMSEAAASAAAFLVEFQGRLGGIVTLGALQSVPEEERWQTPVGQVTRRLERQHLLSPAMPLEAAAHRLGEEQLPLLPVLSRGALVGVLRREAVERLVEPPGAR